MSYFKDIKEWLKNYKGVASAKGKFVDYSEAHALQHSFFRGFAIQRPSKLMSRLNAPVMDKEQWENSEGQYKDTALVVGYVSSKVVAGGSVVGGLAFSGLVC